ncbi:MAG: hypothetical protein AAF478_02655 [Pseudomonadota bacterium]
MELHRHRRTSNEPYNSVSVGDVHTAMSPKHNHIFKSIAQSQYYFWSMEFLEAGKMRLGWSRAITRV